MRWQSTDAVSAAATAAPTNPKITGIVDQISQLTLLETADLVASLKVCDRVGLIRLQCLCLLMVSSPAPTVPS